MLLLFYSLLLFQNVHGYLSLAEDLKKDRYSLQHDNGIRIIDKDASVVMGLFERYSHTDLSGMLFSQKRSGKHVIYKWKRVGDQPFAIYQIKSTIKVDSLFHDIYIDGTETKPAKGYHVKTTFTYRSYIIDDGSKPRLIYMTDDHNGPIMISVGKRHLEILHEDVPIGWVTPDIKQLLSFLN